MALEEHLDRREIARAVIEALVPDEAALFDAIWRDFETDPDAPLSEAEVYNNSLAAGGGLEVRTLSTVVVALVAEIDLSAGPEEVARLAEEWVAREKSKGSIPQETPELDRLPSIVSTIASKAA